MSLSRYATFSAPNRRMILLLLASHLIWCCAVLGLWFGGRIIQAPSVWWSALFIAVQLFFAAQLLLPTLLLHPEERSRGFYLLWGGLLLLAIWLVNLLEPVGDPAPVLAVFKSGLLLLVATVTGAAMARYVNRLWELVPICLVMTLGDFVSWLYGPTSRFVQQIREYYLAPEGPPPLVDMFLVKLALPGQVGLAPLFGISDWIMVVFFAIVAHRFDINDNLIGRPGEILARRGQVGRYLPISVAALVGAILLAQTSGFFLPALPVIATVMLVWHAARRLLPGSRSHGQRGT